MKPNSLVKQLQDNNHNILSYLFDLYYERLYYFAERFIYDKDKSHDIVQDVFIKIWTSRHKLDKELNIKSYMFMSVKNSCLNYLKKLEIEDRNNRKYIEAFVDSENVEFVEDIELITLVKNIITNLPKQTSKVIKYRFFYNYAYQEIAEELEISMSSVKVQINRAKKMIKEKLYNANSKELSLFIFIAFKNNLI